MEEDNPVERRAVDLAVLEVRISNVESDLKDHVKTQKEQFKEVRESLKDLVEKVNNRLPLWATIAFMLLTGAIGWLLKG